MVRMVAFQTHMRDVLVRPGDEFEVTAEEAHAYAARKNPLAGPLDAEAEDLPIATRPAGPRPPAPMATLATPALAKPGRKGKAK